jgi:hypothetical protein
VLQATLVDTWASTAAGAFALSENNLYTTDAFRDYLNHLTDDGLMVSRAGVSSRRARACGCFRSPLRRSAKWVRTDAWRHVVVLRDHAQNVNAFGALDTVLIFRKPLGDAGCRGGEIGVEPDQAAGALYSRAMRPSNEFGELLTSADPAVFWRNYRYNVTPVDDDRPFFFYTVQPRDVLNFLKQGGLSGGLQDQSRAAAAV